jgi:hypothetical protein
MANKNPSMKNASKNISAILNPKRKKKTPQDKGKSLIKDLEKMGVFI